MDSSVGTLSDHRQWTHLTMRRLRPRVHKLDLMASKPGAVPLCQHTGGTSQTPEQGGGCYYYYVLRNLVFRPKKKKFSVVRRPTAQQSPYPRLLSTTMWTLLLLRSLPLNNPFSMWLRQLWPQRGRGGVEKALQCRHSHPGCWGFSFASWALRAVAGARESVPH